MPSTAAQKKAQRAARKAREIAAQEHPVLSSIPGGVDAPRPERTARPPLGSPVIMSGREIPDSGYVVVGCKLPQGLILRVFRMVKQMEPVLGGGVREFEVGQPIGESYQIKGPGMGLAKTKTGLPVIGDYEYTEGIPAQFFKEWVRQNHDQDVVKNHLIFWMPDVHGAQDKGKEHRLQRTGFEPLNPISPTNPTGDVRVPRPTNPQLSRLEMMQTKGT